MTNSLFFLYISRIFVMFYNTYQCRICKQRNDYFFVRSYEEKYLKK